jgi:catechol 2,3-dioxygenase-like lactoylglutathione lyase family enzyme
MVRDVAASIKFYEGLGFTLAFRDSPTDPKYAGIRRDAVELHLQWHDADLQLGSSVAIRHCR